LGQRRHHDGDDDQSEASHPSLPSSLDATLRMLLLIVASGPDAGRLTIWSPMLRGPTGRSTVRKYCVKTLHTMPGRPVRNMYGQFRGRETESGTGIRRGRSHDPAGEGECGYWTGR